MTNPACSRVAAVSGSGSYRAEQLPTRISPGWLSLVLLLLCSVTAVAQQEWTWRNPLPPHVQYNAVNQANGKCLVFGNGGTLLVSEDTEEWRVVPTGTNRNLNAAVYAEQKWTAVGEQGVVLQSSDGEKWTVHSSGSTQPLRGICFGNGRYVAVGGTNTEGTIMSSIDGVTWTAHHTELPYYLTSVAYGNGTFVALCERNLFYTSPDGVNWTERAHVDESTYFGGITFGEGKFVAVGSKILTSTDGISWIIQVSQGVWLNEVILSGGTFYGAGAAGQTMLSDDAITWSAINAPVDSETHLFGVGTLNGFSIWAGAEGALLTTRNRTEWYQRGEGSTVNPKHLAYGNGIYVGSYGFHSLTGTQLGQWTIRRVDTSVADIAFGNGQFITYDVTSIRSSTDGITWTQRAKHGGFSRAARYVGNRFFVLGLSRIDTSIDGLTWQKVILPGLGFLESVAFGNGSYVAVGFNNSEGLVWTSKDGITWPGQTTAVPSKLTDVAFANGLFVATAQDGSIYTSPDAAVWTKRLAGTNIPLLRIAWGDGIFVASGSFGKVFSSPDGVTWTDRSLPTSGELRVIHTGQEFAASGTRIATSLDGNEWMFRSPFLPEKFLDVTHGHAGFVAISDWHTNYIGSTILSSPDGITWTARATVHDYLEGVDYANGLYFVGGENGKLLTSPDGVHWTSRVPSSTEPLRSFAHGNGVYVAVGGGHGGEILSSTDGITWTSRTDESMGNELNSVVFANGLFVAVGGAGNTRLRSFITTSPDGITWTPRSITLPLESERIFHDVAYGNGTFVAVGEYGAVATSPNGTEWTMRLADSSDGYRTLLTDVRFLGGRFVALRPWRRELATSPDGLSWTIHPVPSPNVLNGLAFGADRFLVVGDYGTILTSPWSAPPAAPSHLSVKALTTTQLQVGWTDVNGELGYTVERKLEPEGEWAVIASELAPNATLFSDAGRTSGTRYAYRLRATYPDGNSEYSAAAFGTTLTMSEQWRLDHFGKIQDSDDAAEMADPDGDTIPNLLERAFALDPRKASAVGMPSAVYYPSMQRAVIQFTRDASQVDLQYDVEVSEDLKTWTTIARSVNGGRVEKVGSTYYPITDYQPGGETASRVEVGQNTYGKPRGYFRVVVRRR